MGQPGAGRAQPSVVKHAPVLEFTSQIMIYSNNKYLLLPYVFAYKAQHFFNENLLDSTKSVVISESVL